MSQNTETDSSVFSEALAFPQIKLRAASARSFRTKIAPSNGSTFLGGSTINIDLAGNLPGQYYNFNQMYLKFKLAVAGGSMRLDRAGAASCIKRIQIETAGAQLYDLNNWNVLATALLDTDSTADYKASSGNIMMGTFGDQLQGKLLAADTPVTFVVPMMLNPLSMTTPHRMIPGFGLSPIKFKITLESHTGIGVASDAAVVTTYTDVELVSLMCELSPGAQAKIDQITKGEYNILCNSYINSQGNIAQNVTQATVNLGVSVSSLERIIVIHRPDDTVSAFDAFNLGNRTTSAISEFQFLINSENYPQRSILCSNSPESYAELLIASHSLTDFKLGNNLNNGVEPLNAQTPSAASVQPAYGALSGIAPGLTKSNCFFLLDGDGDSAGTVSASGAAFGNATASNVGTFLCSCEFENGISDGRSSHIYSGVSTISSNVQYKATYGAVHAAATIDFFSQFTVLLSLNMRRSGVWGVSV
jgi:hypothetical protein